MSTIRRVNILGVGVHPITMQEALSQVDSVIALHQKGYICATGVHGIMEAQRDAGLKDILNRSLLTTPDGRPTVWVGWLQGVKHMTQVTGPEFMLQLCAASVRKGYKHFLYGGCPGVAAQLKHHLMRMFPGLNVVGTYTPPFGPLSSDEASLLIRCVASVKPDIFWVGLSTPKQERFMADYIHVLETSVMVGVGAAFDMHTGRIQDSPVWIKKAGLQWFHRLLQDPKRLWRRYLTNNPRFVYKVALQLFHLARYETS